MGEAELREAKREARGEAIVFVLVAIALLIALGLTSMHYGWELAGVGGWIWFVQCAPQVVLVVALFLLSEIDDDAFRHRVIQVLLGFVVAGNLFGLGLLITGLLTEKTADLTGAQLLASGAVVWASNVIAFGLWYWILDCGGPIERAKHGRRHPDFQFPQDENPELKREGWYPRLEDYVYVALTNGIAFSPTDSMPLTRSAKSLMTVESLISVAALLLVAARAINVLGS